MDFTFLGSDSCHLILPPGCLLGHGLVDGNPEEFNDLSFSKVEYLHNEGSTGPLPGKGFVSICCVVHLKALPVVL